MIPGSGRNGAAGLEAFGRRQALFVRRMMVLSLLFHGGAAFLGSIVSHLFPVAAAPPVVPVELTDAPMSPSVVVPPAPPVAPAPHVNPDSAVAARSPAPRIKEPDSSVAHRWLEKLDARLAAVPRSQVARVTGRAGGIPVRRRGDEAVPRPGDLPTGADPGANLPPGNLIEERETRMRASGRRGVGAGIEAEASVMFGGTGQPGGEPIPSWIRDMIRRKVREHLPELETVYNEALRRNPGLKGKLLIRFRIDAAGRIEQAESMDPSIRDAPFLEAVLENVRRWTFEPTGGRTVDVLYPLVFFVPS